MNLTCERCGKQIDFSSGEKKFYDEHQLDYPKKCKACRNAFKQRQKELDEMVNKRRVQTKQYISEKYTSLSKLIGGPDNKHKREDVKSRKDKQDDHLAHLVRWKQDHPDEICSNCSLTNNYNAALILQFFCHNCIMLVDEYDRYYIPHKIQRCYFAENLENNQFSNDFTKTCIQNSKRKNIELICPDCCLNKDTFHEEEVKSLACPICRLSDHEHPYQFFRHESADAFINGELKNTYYYYLKNGYKSLRDRLMYMYFDGQPVEDVEVYKKIYKDHYILISNQRYIYRDTKANYSCSNRVLDYLRINAIIVTPERYNKYGKVIHGMIINNRKINKTQSIKALDHYIVPVNIKLGKNQVWARIEVCGDKAIIEPANPNRAAYVIDSNDAQNKMIDLNKIDHKRVTHHKKGLKHLKSILSNKNK
jgi:hypothetical protein